MRAFDDFIADQGIELTELYIESIPNRRDVLHIEFLKVGPRAEIDTADKIRITPGVELHLEAGTILPIAACLCFFLQNKLSKIRPKLIRVYIENAKLVDAAGRVIEILCVGPIEIAIEPQAPLFR